MPPKLKAVTAETVAPRIELQPDTISLAAAKAIYNRLGDTAAADGHHELKVEAYALAETIQELIDTPAPDGLVASARMITSADLVLESATDLRAEIATAYDRFHSATAQATEGLEVLTAWTVMLEVADFDLRTGSRAA